MARKFDLITELYQQTQKRVTKPQEWQRFCRLPAAITSFRSMSSSFCMPSARMPPRYWR